MKTLFFSILFTFSVNVNLLALTNYSSNSLANELIREKKLQNEILQLQKKYYEEQLEKIKTEKNRRWLENPENQQLIGILFSAFAMAISLIGVYAQLKPVLKSIQLQVDEIKRDHFDKILDLTVLWNEQESTRDLINKKFPQVDSYGSKKISIKEIQILDKESLSKGSALFSIKVINLLNVIELMAMAICTESVNSSYIKNTFQNVVIYYSTIFSDYIDNLDKDIAGNNIFPLSNTSISYPYIKEFREIVKCNK